MIPPRERLHRRQGVQHPVRHGGPGRHLAPCAKAYPAGRIVPAKVDVLPVDYREGLAGRYVKAIGRRAKTPLSGHVRLLLARKGVVLPLFRGPLGRTAAAGRYPNSRIRRDLRQAPRLGLEPRTKRLTAACSTD